MYCENSRKNLDVHRVKTGSRMMPDGETSWYLRETNFPPSLRVLTVGLPSAFGGYLCV